MVHYGTDNKYLLKIVNIDQEPEIAGVKLAHFPSVIFVSIFPLSFDLPILTVFFLFSQIVFFVWAGAREAEGRPITLNARLVHFGSYLPDFLKSGLFPSISSIKPFCKNYRR